MGAFGVFVGFGLFLYLFFYGASTGNYFWWALALLAALAAGMAGGPDP